MKTEESVESPTDIVENQQEITVKTVVTLEANGSEPEQDQEQKDEAVAETSTEPSEPVTESTEPVIEPTEQVTEPVEQKPVVASTEEAEAEKSEPEVEKATEEPAKIEESDDCEVTVSEQATLVESTVVVEEPETDSAPEAETPVPDKDVDHSDLTNVTQEVVEPTAEGNFLQFCSHFKQASDETVNEQPSSEPVELVVDQGKLI